MGHRRDFSHAGVCGIDVFRIQRALGADGRRLRRGFILGRFEPVLPFGKRTTGKFERSRMKKAPFPEPFLKSFADHGSELAARENMNMQMRHFLTAVFADIA